MGISALGLPLLSTIPKERSTSRSSRFEPNSSTLFRHPRENTCNSLFIRYNHAHGNYAAAKRGHRLSFELHPEEWLLSLIRRDRQRPGPQFARHGAQTHHQSPEQRPSAASPQSQPFYRCPPSKKQQKGRRSPAFDGPNRRR